MLIPLLVLVPVVSLTTALGLHIFNFLFLNSGSKLTEELSDLAGSAFLVSAGIATFATTAAAGLVTTLAILGPLGAYLIPTAAFLSLLVGVPHTLRNVHAVGKRLNLI